MNSYQNKYVAFADILGFENLVNRTAEPDPEVPLAKMLSALDIPNEVKLEGIILGRVGDITEASHRLSTFSDCLAISTEATEKGLMNLLFHLRAIAFRLLKLGYLLRGGIAEGALYHEDGKIVGPALVDAYNLEKNVAKYPRIIVDSRIVTKAKRWKPPLDTIFKRLTRDDGDGYSFVHYLWAIRMAADSDQGFIGDWEHIVSEIGDFVECEKRRLAGEENHLPKILWFEKYFEWARDRSHIDVLSSPFPR
ncbi:MAG: hypothetical protein ACP5EQ_07420 [Candidatus Cloacimonadia bacterium]